MASQRKVPQALLESRYWGYTLGSSVSSPHSRSIPKSERHSSGCGKARMLQLPICVSYLEQLWRR